jgi:hypothetical protein
LGAALAWWLLGATYVPHYEWLLGLPLLGLLRGRLAATSTVWWLLGALGPGGMWWGMPVVFPVVLAWLALSPGFRTALHARPGGAGADGTDGRPISRG